MVAGILEARPRAALATFFCGEFFSGGERPAGSQVLLCCGVVALMG